MDPTKDVVFEEFHLDSAQPQYTSAATPQVNGPRSSSSRGDEKSPQDPSSPLQPSPLSSRSASEVRDGDPIVWHYLTYETHLPQPTHTPPPEKAGKEAPEEPNLTAYRNPLEWSPARKSVLIWISTIATTVTAYVAGDYASGVDQMSAEWNISQVVALVGIPAFATGFGIAPMFLAPFSELNGRRPIFLITGFLFFVFDLCCGLTRTYAGMIVSRFLVGCASSTFSTMVGGVVADIYGAGERSTPLTIYSGGVIFGTGIGPLISGFIAQNTDWRWIYYSHSILTAALVVVLVLFFSETRGSVLLSRKAGKLNAWYEAREAAGYYGFDMDVQGSSEKQSQRIRWKVKADEERATVAQMIKISLIRPIHLLFTEPVVFFVSLWISFAWSILFATFSVIPYAYQTVYNFSLQQSGAIFSSISIAGILTTFLCLGQEKLAKRWGKLPSGPESRLVFVCVESALIPIGLFWFGWTTTASIPWIVPTLALGFATVGIFTVYLSVFNYFADTYHRYASSAIAAQSFARSLMAGVFPLFTQQMFARLGFGVAGSLLGGIGVVLTFVPWVLVFFGPKIRARSKFASEIMAEK